MLVAELFRLALLLDTEVILSVHFINVEGISSGSEIKSLQDPITVLVRRYLQLML